MKKTMLCLALLTAMGAAGSAMAQSFDDRWYIDASTGVNFQDKDRQNNNQVFGMIGFGKPLTPNWAIELNFNYQRPRETHPDVGLFWLQEGVSVDALYHFTDWGNADWDPYFRAGLGWQHNNEKFTVNNVVVENKNDNVAGIIGFGLEAKYGRYNLRSEIDARFDNDSGNLNTVNRNYFVDYLANFGVTIALGPAPSKPVEVAPPPPAPVVTCADKDSDGDGVNDCNDKCPNTPPGTTVGPDGCPVPVTIDLRGVNFDFDKSKLRPDAVAILNEAIQVLQKYPQMRVEVAGHTDLCGSDGYNMKLSQRRAKAVYDYLTKNGVDASRLVGPNGYGETHPLEQTPQTYPACKSEKNRRTELNVQN